MFPVSALWKKSVDTYFDVNGVGICTPLQLLLASVQLVYIPQIAPGEARSPYFFQRRTSGVCVWGFLPIIQPAALLEEMK